MPEQSDRAVVEEIISENRYLTLATTDGEDPWVAPVEYTVDDEYNFYFISLDTSRHVKHLQANPTVAFAIFDSRQPSLTGEGVQVRGEVETFSDRENPFTTFDDRPELPDDITEIDPGYDAYKITPTRFYVPEAYLREDGLDRRVAVDMDR